MQGVLRDGQPLRFERRTKLLDAEQSSRVSQQVPYEPAQSRHVAHVVPLDHVAEHCHVYVVAKKLIPRRRIQALRFRKAARREPVEESAFEPRALPAGHHGRIVGECLPLVPERLLETEGMNQYLPRAAAESGRDFS